MSYRLTDIVRGGSAERRSRPALCAGSRTLTYAELDQRSNQVAQALRSAGVQAGERVVHLDKNTPEFFELLFGAVKIGAVLAPVNWRLTVGEVAAVVADSQATLLVVGPDFAELGRQVAARLASPVRVLERGGEYEQWLASAAPDDPGHEGADDDVVVQLYTSGTTGLPKGVMLSHRNFTELKRAGEPWLITPDAVSLIGMPLFHIGGSGWALVGLQYGARNVILSELDPVMALDLLEHERVTHTFLVPAALAFLAAVPGAAARDFSALQVVAYGASPITTEVLRTVMATFRAPMYQVYGLTETTGAVVQLDPEDHDPGGPRERLLRSAGKPYDWVELAVVEVETGRVLSAGEVGEVRVRSVGVTQGYWHRPEETSAAVDSDGWLHTGDAGYLDAEGYLFLTDRIKDMIVSGGENVYPIEVEEVLSQHPGIADVAVIGVPDERWGETVMAVVVARPGASLEPDEVVSWTKGRLAGFKRPRSVTVVDTLPRNPSGKVLKKELRAPYWVGRDRAIG